MPIIQQGGGNIELEGGGSLLQEGESAAIVNEFTIAFGELLDVQEYALHERKTVTVDGTAGIDAVVEAVPRDEIYIDGGKAEGRTFRLHILASDLGSVEPDKFVSVSFTPPGTSQAFAGEVLAVESNNGIFLVTVGDPNSIS